MASLALPGGLVIQCFLGLSCDEISEKTALTIFTFFEHPIAMKLSHFRNIKLRSQMKPISVLRN